MKKVIFILLALSLIIGVCAIQVSAEEIIAEGMCGANVKWSLSGETLTISGTGPMDDAIYDDVGGPWYEYRSQIRHVVIEEGVTSVGKLAFSNYRPLKSIKIADSVTTIEEYAFFCCYDVAEITLGSGIETIGEMAFFSCFEVQEIELPQSVKTIGMEAFGDCWALKKINIPEGITTIPAGAFRNTAISEITIPASVTRIGTSAFKYCDDLKTVFYTGTQEQWNAVAIDNTEGSNNILLNAQFFFCGTQLGDITADGSVNNEDVAYLLWHTLFPADYPLTVNGDLTGDGETNNEDVSLLLWHTLFPEDYPL